MDRSTDLHILSTSEMFRGLSLEALDDVRQACVRRRVVSGEMLLRQGEPASAVHVVIAGRLRVAQATDAGQQVIIRYVGAGETAGYNAVLGGGTYSTSVAAVEDTTVLTFGAGKFRQLMTKHPPIAANALAIVHARYEELQTRLRELATETVERRIAHALLRLAGQAGRRTSTGIEIGFPLSRQDVAEMTGTTLHTVSRTLSHWETKGLVASGRRRVVIRRPEELLLLAGDPPPE
jgi:CRP-like cAMP-binding protein